MKQLLPENFNNSIHFILRPKQTSAFDCSSSSSSTSSSSSSSTCFFVRFVFGAKKLTEILSSNN
jgi:hypothetical protein